MSWVGSSSSVVVVLLAVYLIALYNGLVQKRNRVDNSWAQIEVQLKRRNILIPNLVETVKGLCRARAGHVRGSHPGSGGCRRRRGSRPRRPAARGLPQPGSGTPVRRGGGVSDLKANVNFLDLQAQLQDTENKIAVSRQVYDDTVLTYNNAIQVVPAVLIAGPLGFTEREFFEIEEAADREVLLVGFQPDAVAAPTAGDAPTPPPA